MVDPQPYILIKSLRQAMRVMQLGQVGQQIPKPEPFAAFSLFPTLAVGLLDFKVDVVLARLEADFSDQPPSIPAVPDHQASLQCPTNEYPCNA